MSVSLLCQSCALCCDGSLFSTVPLELNEVAAVRDAALTVRQNADGGSLMPQPCRALEGSRCTQYEARPTACRRFTCHLATALAEGEVDLDEAQGVVGGAREVIGKVETALAGPEKGGAALQRARREPRPTESLESARDAAERYLRRHFLGRSLRR